MPQYRNGQNRKQTQAMNSKHHQGAAFAHGDGKKTETTCGTESELSQTERNEAMHATKRYNH